MAKKKPRQRGWVPSPPTVDPAGKAQAEEKAKDFIEKTLKPKHVKPPPSNATSNYLTDITLKWHGSTLFFVAVYACPGANAILPSFEEKFARLRPAASGLFDLSFMRHTGQWVELYQGLTLEKCLETIRDDPWFLP